MPIPLQSLLLPVSQAASAPETATADAVGRWSAVMMGLILLAIVMIVAGLVVVILRRHRRQRAGHSIDGAGTPEIDPWTEAGRRTPTPPSDDEDDPDLYTFDPEDQDR